MIAEGIEHESQLHRLVELGCEQGQGFLMARPLDGADAETLIADYAGAIVNDLTAPNGGVHLHSCRPARTPAPSGETTMTTLQTEYTEAELLSDHDIVEPLIVDGVHCHGGFDEHGTYVSPRTKHRWPAIEAWEQQRLEQFSHPDPRCPLETWPENFPNVDSRSS